MQDLLDNAQLAEALQIHPDTIRRLTRDNAIPHHKIGGVVRYSLSAILAATRVTKHPDDEAVDAFAAAMHEKLAKKREEGRGGWDDPEVCPDAHLVELLAEAVTKGDPVDIANFCMMLHQRGVPTFGIAAGLELAFTGSEPDAN